jgi:putative GTP pyrophosphokinase
MTEKHDIERFHSEYSSILEIQTKFCGELVRAFNDLMIQNHIDLGFPLASRVKSWESIEEKFGRLSRTIKKITDYQDLVGIRVILLFPRDVDKVKKLIDDNFKIIREYDTRDRLDPDQFGYVSSHFVVEFPEKWFAFPTLQPFKGLKAEIQVRTLSQHLWSEASRVLQYKQEDNVPVPLKRSISRISALLELIDLEYERLLDERDEYRKNLTEAKSDAILNTDSLEFVLDNSLPKTNKDQGEYYGELLGELIHFHIDTPEKLKTFIDKHIYELLKIDKEIVVEKRKSKTFITSEEKARVEAGVFLTHTGLIRSALENEYGREWRTQLLQ